MTYLTKTQKQAYNTVEEIIALGWIFKGHNGYSRGWWVNPGSDKITDRIRRGDPKGFYEGARIVKELYLKE